MSQVASDVIEPTLRCISYGEIDDLKVVFDLVERCLSDEHFGTGGQPIVVLRHRQDVNVVHIIQQPRAGQDPLNAAGVKGASNVGGGCVQLSKPGASQLTESRRVMNLVEFNMDNGLAEIGTRRKVERDAGDVRSVLRDVEGIQPGVVRDERHRLLR